MNKQMMKIYFREFVFYYHNAFPKSEIYRWACIHNNNLLLNPNTSVKDASL